MITFLVLVALVVAGLIFLAGYKYGARAVASLRHELEVAKSDATYFSNWRRELQNHAYELERQLADKTTQLESRIKSGGEAVVETVAADVAKVENAVTAEVKAVEAKL